MPTPVKRTVTPYGVGSGGGGGGGGTNAGLFGLFTITPSAGNAIIDILANGVGTTTFNFRLVLNATPVNFVVPIWTSSSIIAGIRITLHVEQDAAGSRPSPTFASGSGGFAADIAAWEVDPTLSTKTVYQLTYMGTIWTRDFITNKVALS